jgi:leucyl aminopeptidase
MQVRVSSDAAASVSAGALVIPVFSDKRLDGAAQDIDAALGGALADVLSSEEIAGKPNELALVHAKDAPYRRVALIGLGERSSFTPNKLAHFAGTAVRSLGKRNVATLAFVLPAEAGANVLLSASAIAEGAIAATLDTTTYRSKAEKPIAVTEIALLAGSLDSTALDAGVTRGTVLGEAINHARIMALMPGNDMTPTAMAQRAMDLGEEAGLEVDVLDEARMLEKGMGSLLGVSRGSDEPATLSVMTYRGDPASNEILALVGKGLTFDSGGISIKPAENMHEMKYDMCGGAGVIAAMYAIGKLKPKLNVIGLIPSSENLPGPRAMKPGDILRAMNGKTIEVINTDAEGRLILADALCYARELGATKLVDCATLTGACVIALGHAASGVMTNDETFVNRFINLVGDVGERYWRLPLYEDFDEQIKSDIADIKNTGGRWGGAETAGAFLKNFVADVPWIHLDIAGTAYADKGTAYITKGPNGTPVRAFVALVEDLAKNGFSTNGKSAGVAAGAPAS